MRVVALSVLLTVLLTPTGASAQTTPWGDPDIQGVWTNQTPIALERPEALAKKPFFTPEEAADLQRTSLTRLLGVVERGIPTSGELNEVWLEAQNGRIHPSRRTSLVSDPPDGKIPYTAEGRKRWDATPSLERELSGKPNGTDGPQDRTYDERCITTGGLFVPNPFYNNYHQIVQAPGYVVIVTEMMHEVRVIPLDPSTGSGSPRAQSRGDRRPRLGEGIRQWNGDSRGWWEGQTLVVETTNFNDKRRFQGATKEMRLVERFTRRDADTISYQLTVTDPATFARPWTLENGLWRTKDHLYEVACHEGNYGLANILSGARVQEKAGTATAR